MNDGEGGRGREREGRTGGATVEAAGTRGAAPVGDLTGACSSFAAGGGEGTGGATRTGATAGEGRRKGDGEGGSNSNISSDGAMTLNENILAKTAPKSWIKERIMCRCT